MHLTPCGRSRTPIRCWVVFAVAGALLAGGARPAHAAIVLHVGDVYCHATAAGPRYFYSGVTSVRISLPSLRYQWWEDWSSLDGVTTRRVERWALDDLALEFVRSTGAGSEVALLSVRCDLMRERGAAAVAIHAARYFRDGALVPYPRADMIAIDWAPDFVAAVKPHVARAVGRNGVLTAYAARPGDVAADGDTGKNSPYTAALLTHLEDAGTQVEVMFRRVAATVIAATNGQQHPEVHSTLADPGAVQLPAATALTASPGLAAPRVALVIGNDAYQPGIALANPVNDALAVAAALERHGFEVTVLTDADGGGLRGALEAFSRQSAYADVALVFYAGQGMRHAEVDYVVPVDADLRSLDTATAQSVAVDRVTAAATGARAPIGILDMSRQDPYAR